MQGNCQSFCVNVIIIYIVTKFAIKNKANNIQAKDLLKSFLMLGGGGEGRG